MSIIQDNNMQLVVLCVAVCVSVDLCRFINQLATIYLE